MYMIIIIYMDEKAWQMHALEAASGLQIKGWVDLNLRPPAF